MKYIIATLGCKVNQYETQAMETILQSRGHMPAFEGEKADAVIVNTCAVTAESGRKSRNMIRRLATDNPGASIAVSGCYSQLEPEKLKELGCNVIYGSADRLGFVDAIENSVLNSTDAFEIDKPFKRKSFESLPAGAVSGRTRAMLKIQDGCVNFCTYCIIPYTRGALRSISLEEAGKLTREIRDRGFRELVLTGIEVASYGRDLPGRPGLADVIETVAVNCGSMRIRLGSLEPTVITEDFCKRLAANGKMCRHFHLSLQSGCDETLKNMNRKYNTEQFYNAVQLLREYFPGCALTADLITGFPGETDENQRDTLAFMKKCGFAAVHVFPYSRRPGTPADKMPGQCTKAVKDSRAREAQQLADEMHSDYMKACIGSTLDVLFETEDAGFSTGHSDNYLLVKAAGNGLHGVLKRVKITGFDGEHLLGDILD